MASKDRTPTQCLTCPKVLLGGASIYVHHQKTHGVSLSGVPREEWTEHVEEHADAVENPERKTVKDHALTPRHPAYADVTAEE